MVQRGVFDMRRDIKQHADLVTTCSVGVMSASRTGELQYSADSLREQLVSCLNAQYGMIMRSEIVWRMT